MNEKPDIDFTSAVVAAILTIAETQDAVMRREGITGNPFGSINAKNLVLEKFTDLLPQVREILTQK